MPMTAITTRSSSSVKPLERSEPEADLRLRAGVLFIGLDKAAAETSRGIIETWKRSGTRSARLASGAITLRYGCQMPLQSNFVLTRVLHTTARRFINTVASARCEKAPAALQPFQRFAGKGGKPLKRLGRFAAYLHRAEAAVLMRMAALGSRGDPPLRSRAEAAVLMRMAAAP
jgi:hypothetical protein